MVIHCLAVSLQPWTLVTTYSILVVPAVVPVVNKPVEEMVPTADILLLLQTPPGVELLNCMVLPTHTMVSPTIGPALVTGLIVNNKVAVSLQPELLVTI